MTEAFAMRSRSSNQQGTCRLCGMSTELIKGHVWPRFAYKHYVADQSRGGSFTNLAQRNVSNRQETRSWFCAICDNEDLSACEKYAADLCKTVAVDPERDVPYDAQFLRFSVSISWRAAMYYQPFAIDNYHRSILNPAIRSWRRFLQGGADAVMPYTQHVYLVPDSVWDGVLGSEVFLRSKVVFTRIGPFMIAGVLDRSLWSTGEVHIWKGSEVLPSGGILAPTREWSVGQNITRPFFKELKPWNDWAAASVLCNASARR